MQQQEVSPEALPSCRTSLVARATKMIPSSSSFSVSELSLSSSSSDSTVRITAPGWGTGLSGAASLADWCLQNPGQFWSPHRPSAFSLDCFSTRKGWRETAVLNQGSIPRNSSSTILFTTTREQGDLNIRTPLDSGFGRQDAELRRQPFKAQPRVLLLWKSASVPVLFHTSSNTVGFVEATQPAVLRAYIWLLLLGSVLRGAGD